MAFFNCRVCLAQDQYGNCKTDATVCVTMRKFNPKCSGYQPLCNPLSGAFVAATTVCQQQLFTGSESTTQARTVTQAYTFTVSAANATVGAVYSSVNSAQFTVLQTISGALMLVAQGTAPPFGTTLTKVSGTGDTTITFSLAVQNGVQVITTLAAGSNSPFNGEPIIASCASLVDLNPPLSPLNSGSVIYS